MNGSPSGLVSSVSSSRAAAACAGGRWVHSTTEGSSWRNGWSDARKAFGSTPWTHGLSTVAQSRWAATRSSVGTAAMSSASACSAVDSGAPKQSEVKQVPVRSS
jgi:hypothetical protein